MATGAGKTKVLSLLIAWSYFHKLYEPDSDAGPQLPADRAQHHRARPSARRFRGLRIFFNDPVLPDNGHDGRNWRDDFQIALHIQDDVRIVRPTGNIFLTNIHRVYLGDVPEPSLEDDDLRDYFLAPFGAQAGRQDHRQQDRPRRDRARDRRTGRVQRRGAPHPRPAHGVVQVASRTSTTGMLQKDLRLALQVDVTATPRHDNGAIFVQTVSDYPLVEAIRQNVVKHPVLPDAASRAKLHEHKSALIHREIRRLSAARRRGMAQELRRAREARQEGRAVRDGGRHPNCDEVGAYLEKICPELQGAVLVIHTKNNGEISEAASGKSKEELEMLRKQSNEIDTWKSPYKAIVSVLMLKEGWDVRNV